MSCVSFINQCKRLCSQVITSKSCITRHFSQCERYKMHLQRQDMTNKLPDNQVCGETMLFKGKKSVSQCTHCHVSVVSCKGRPSATPAPHSCVAFSHRQSRMPAVPPSPPCPIKLCMLEDASDQQQQTQRAVLYISTAMCVSSTHTHLNHGSMQAWTRPMQKAALQEQKNWLPAENPGIVQKPFRTGTVQNPGTVQKRFRTSA